MYQFDIPRARTGTSSIKWDRYKSKFDTDRTLIPLWIADTDFRKYSFLDPDRSFYNYQSVRGSAWLDEKPDYFSLKFRCANGDYQTYTVGASVDIPVMRVIQPQFEILFQYEFPYRIKTAIHKSRQHMGIFIIQ